MAKRRTTGMVLGKFFPPHLGHKHLVDFARSYADEVTVIVGTLARETIPGALRYEWMQRICAAPNVRVVHLTDENPQYPHEHPDFWNIWKASLTRMLPGPVDYVFASESYGWPLAEVLGAEFVPVDISRSMVPVSGTAIRENPLANWEFLPPCVRPYFLRRICVFGPESTGKSTLTKNLAAEFETSFVGEYARVVLESKKGSCTADDLPRILRGQRAASRALAEQSNRVLFSDTDEIATLLWHHWLFGEGPGKTRYWRDAPRELVDAAESANQDLYLVCDVDVPWIGDSVRYFPEGRGAQFDDCIRILDAFEKPYRVVSGGWDERLASAAEAVREATGVR